MYTQQKLISKISENPDGANITQFWHEILKDDDNHIYFFT